METREVCVTFSDFSTDPGSGRIEDAALAILTGTSGPAYRPIGAAMWVRAGRVVSGSISAGCVERDIALHAMECLREGRGRRLRYGAGSPYFDIRLPCGGSLDVTIIPGGGLAMLAAIRAAQAAQREITIGIDEDETALVAPDEASLRLRLIPEVQFHVFGKGPEAVVFAELAASASYVTDLYSADTETLAAIRDARVRKGLLRHKAEAPDLALGRHSAVVLFFHDHDWEPTILAAAAASDAFYIGAQGSSTTRRNRDEALRDLGVSAGRIAQIKGPAGLIARARDARTLAISVLAEVVAEAEHLRRVP